MTRLLICLLMASMMCLVSPRHVIDTPWSPDIIDYNIDVKGEGTENQDMNGKRGAEQCYLPCLHGGTCINLGGNTHGCACTPDWQGSLCQDKKCTLPCKHGSCLYTEDGSPFCNCPWNWTGNLCGEKRTFSLKW